MPMRLEVYAFQDAAGNPFGDFLTQDIREAWRYARRHKVRVVARQLVYGESETVEDFTETEEDYDAA